MTNIPCNKEYWQYVGSGGEPEGNVWVILAHET